ncbi:MAG: ParA family protein [Cellulosilyticaceae bacterium]
MKTVFWGNYKGGVGKTTSVFQIAGWFASKGKKVLLIDLDPQCSLSSICCANDGNKALSKFGIRETFNYLIELYSDYIAETPNFRVRMLTDKLKNRIKPIVKDMPTCIEKDAFEGNLYFIPSTSSFENARINEMAQRMSHNTLNVLAMKMFIDDLGEEFDYVFFDCPPTTNILIESVFLASDYYIVPTIVDEISAKGVQDYIIEIEKTYQKYCMDLNVGGVMMKAIYTKRTQFIGAFETIYKERSGNSHNEAQVEKLDQNIGAISGLVSLLGDQKYREHCYNKQDDGFESHNIFKYYISNKDNRTSGESIPKNTARAILTPAYEELADVLMSMI